MENVAIVVIGSLAIIGVLVLGFLFIRGIWRADAARLAWLHERTLRAKENTRRVREEQQRLREQQK